MKKLVHSTALIGIEDLMQHKANKGSYLCCSSIGCNHYFNREIMFRINGEVLREFDGDIGSLGMSATNYGYDEIHVGDYEVEALFIPSDRENWSLEVFRDAYYYITMILQETIQVVSENENEEEIEFVTNLEHYEPENMNDDEFLSIWSNYNLDLTDEELIG